MQSVRCGSLYEKKISGRKNGLYFRLINESVRRKKREFSAGGNGCCGIYLAVDFALLLHVDMRLGGKRQDVTDHRQGGGSRGKAARSPLPQQLADYQKSQAATE